MRKIVLVMAPVFLVLAGVGASGQYPIPPPRPVPAQAAQAASVADAAVCPRIEVQSQSARNVREGQPVTFVANIAGGDPKVTPQIIWSVSGGAIKDGQETKKIEVDSAGAGAMREIVADVWVGGYAPECTAQASGAVRVVPPASKADEFGDLEAEKENERLASVLAAVSQSDDHVYIIAYAGRTSPRGHASTALKRMRTQLLTNGLDPGRIGVTDGGFREQAAYELWLVPQGAETPKPTPTVDRREIVYPRATPALVKKPAKP